MQDNNIERDLATEIVKAIEAGFDKHLRNSIKYSAFRLFFAMFKKTNPTLIEQVREYVRNDVYYIVTAITDYRESTFINYNEIQPKGQQLLQICYNIGIHLLKKRLNVVTVFKLINDAQIRNETYNYLLEVVHRSTSRVLHNH